MCVRVCLGGDDGAPFLIRKPSYSEVAGGGGIHPDPFIY